MSLLYELLSNPDRAVALERFLEQWHGIRLAAPQDGVYSGLPPLLEDVLDAVERNPRLCGQNHLYSPYEEGHGLLVFASEREGAFEWGCQPAFGDDDPPMWGRWLLDRPEDEAGPGWLPEAERLSGFLLQFLLFETIMGAPWWVQYPAARPALVRMALGPLRPVLGTWRWPGPDGTFHAADDTLAFTCGNPYVGDGTVDVTLAAREAGALEHLAGVAADGWLVRGPDGTPGPPGTLPGW
jgi:hypothetical protein